MPALPPRDEMSASIARAVYAPTNISQGDSVITGPFPIDVIWLWFKDDATQPERQEAVDAIDGEVIGGKRIRPGGIYYIRIRTGGTSDSLQRAIARLKRFPQVRLATVDLSLVSGVVHAQIPNRCSVARPDDNRALSQLQHWVTSTGAVPARDSLLRSLGVYGVSRDQIARVTDDSTCARAIATRASFLQIADDGRPIRVYLVGTEYFVEEIGSKERRIFWIFDQSWNYAHGLAL
ncbi:MAG TPA: hypothetical protein VGT98_12595 [Candidatus Elarobacter sp.]|nr:hypothetical protein [Candidatus Elarobacter sp.]